MIELPRYAAGEIAALNRLHRPRQPAEVELAGQSYRIEFGEPSAPATERELLEVEFDGRLIWVDADQGLRDRLIGQAFDGVDVPLDPELATCLLEAALEPLLERLEHQLHRRMVIRNLAAHSAPAIGRVIALKLVPVDQGLPIEVDLRVDPVSLDMVADCFDLLPTTTRSSWDGLRIDGVCELGRARLRVEELRGAQPGDLLIVQETALSERRVVLRFGNVLRFSATIDGSTVTVAAGGEGRMAEEEEEGEGAPPPPAVDVDAIEVALTFQLGRLQLSVGELRHLGEGHSFDLGKDLSAPVDVVANGQLIGRGALIEIDQRIGVRISQWFDRD